MHVRTLVLGTFAAALLAACATQEPAEPAPQPAPAPAPQPAPRPVEAPKPVAKPEAPKPEAPKPEAPKPKPPSVVNLSATQLFAYDSATLSDAAKKVLDEQVVTKLKDLASIRYININGHTDRIGSPQYNQRLSEKRAEAVRDYLASRGVDASKMEIFGFGKTMPVQHCSGRMPRDVLIACLQPNRRVVVEIQGTPR
ncbi:MAG TPA: OmpA family protein [Burkholderiales bacterium]